MSVTVRTHRLGLYLKSRDRRLSRNIAYKSVITNSKQLTQKSVDSYRQLEFEVRQQSLTEMEEWKFQSSTVDTIARRQFIEDQNTILELAGRVQALQKNKVNCLNDSKEFQDAESVRIGKSFPPHPIPEGMLRHFSYRQVAKKGRHVFVTHTVLRETFVQFQMRLHQHLNLKNCVNGIRQSKSRSIRLQWRKVKDQNKIKTEMPVWTISQRFSHLQWRKLFKESWCRPTTTADF